jgi:hypothetical protein
MRGVDGDRVAVRAEVGADVALLAVAKESTMTAFGARDGGAASFDGLS